MLGVLDRWTPTVNTCILQKLIELTSLHIAPRYTGSEIELCPIEARYTYYIGAELVRGRVC